MKRIHLNGQNYSLTTSITLLQLINYLNYNLEVIVLEHNRVIYNRKEWETISLTNSDCIEIITIVGGG